jgi:hypothetical protein
MKAHEWRSEGPHYKELRDRFRGELRDTLKKRFDRFAVLHRWSFVNPEQCRFSVESLQQQGALIPANIEQTLLNDLFVPEDFEAHLLEAAAHHVSLGAVLRELQEPRPAELDCIPWLGETAAKERIVRLCARGKLAINVRGREYLEVHGGEDEPSALQRLRSKLSYTGRELDEIILMRPARLRSGSRSDSPAAPSSQELRRSLPCEGAQCP